VVLAERVALLSWRLCRVTLYETGAIAITQAKIEEDIHDRRRLMASLRGERFAETHPGDIRGLARYRKRAHIALRRFSSHAPDKVLNWADASAVVRGVLDTVNKRTGKGIAKEELNLPGDLQDIHELSELPAMKAAEVQECLEVIAAHASLSPDELLEAAIEQARYEAAIAAHKKEDMEREVSREAAGRILPDGKDAGEDKPLRSTLKQAAIPRPPRTRSSDPGQSGASLERPGMDRVRDLVAAALVHEVMKEVGEEVTNIGVDEDQRVPVEAETQVCDCWAEKE